MTSQLLLPILIASGISLYIFSVALKTSMVRCQSYTGMLKTSLSFALTQGLLFSLGWYISISLVGWIPSFAQPLGMIVFFLLGTKIILLAADKKSDPALFDVSRLNILLLLSIATATNGFIAGLGTGLIQIALVPAAYILSGLTFLFSLSGIVTGKTSGKFTLAFYIQIGGGMIILLAGILLLLDALNILKP